MSAGKVEKATLVDGKTVDYVFVNDPPSGAMKKTYFAPDRSYVVQFYLDPSQDVQREARLKAIIERFNPTSDPDPRTAAYWRTLFCWPTAMVTRPQLGVVAPCYPSNFFFEKGPFKGCEKKGKWFSSPKLRKHLLEADRGTWVNYFQVCILIARAVRRLHQAGLAHSDLSSNNILIDPGYVRGGKSIVIDIDSLVVPQIYPPDVMGTRGYIAPEVLATQGLPFRDPRRQHPNVRTDLHALAVLIYDYLLNRHPLEGRKIHSAVAEEDDLLAMGSRALFIEHPTDHSNWPKEKLKLTHTVLGTSGDRSKPFPGDLILQAFVDGLHDPHKRPTAMDWERALIRAWDHLLPCENSSCTHKWFVFHDSQNPRCPFCGTRTKLTVPVLKFHKETSQGHWMENGRLVVYHNSPLFRWHVYDNIFPGEQVDRDVPRQAFFAFHLGKWLLVNEHLPSLTSPSGNRVPAGQAVELKDGVQIRLSQEPHGRIAEVQIVRA
jgi:serine/threonine protein kinase